MTYHHDRPALYFVGPTYSQFMRYETGFVFAEFQQGIGKPRYLLFSSVFEAQVHVASVNRQLKPRGLEMEMLLSNHPQHREFETHKSTDMSDYPDSVNEEDSCYWRSIKETGKAKPYSNRGWAPGGARRITGYRRQVA